MLRLLVFAGLVATCFATSCIDCMCIHESGCKPLACSMGATGIGYFQIKLPYYIDCGEPGKKEGETSETAWKRCADDLQCSKTCVQNYYEKYKGFCPGVGTCQQMARIHNGGPSGCKYPSTITYWNAIKKCCNCS